MNRGAVHHMIIQPVASALTCLAVFMGTSQAAGQSRIVRLNEVRQTGFEFLASPSYEPRDVTVTPEGKVIFSVKALDSRHPKIMQLAPDGQSVAFPSPEWAGNRKSDGKGFNQIVGLTSGDDGVVWILERGARGQAPRIVGWDTRENKLKLAYPLGDSGMYRDVPFLQDLAMDTKRRLIYLAGTEKGAKLSTAMPLLGVLDIRNKKLRVIRLQRPNVGGDSPEKVLGAAEISTGTAVAGLNVPIALDPACEWVYFAFLGRQEIWRVKADDLANPGLSASALSQLVVDYGTKPVSNSIAADDAGNVYVADEGKTGIGVWLGGKEYRVNSVDSALKYPNCLTLARDGYLYVSVKRPTFISFDEKTYDSPYYLARIKAQTVTKGR